MKTVRSINRLRISDFCILACVLIVPLIMWYKAVPVTAMEMNFTSGKIYQDFFNYWKGVAIISLSAIGVLSYVVNALTEGRQHVNKITVIVLAVFAVAVTATYFGAEDKAVFFRGLVDRFEGYWVWLAYIGLILISADAAARSKRFSKIFIYAISSSAVIVGVLSVLQYYGVGFLNSDFVRYLIAPDAIAKTDLRFFTENGMAYGTLSNPNYLGGYAGAVSLLTFSAIFTSGNIVEKNIFRIITGLLIAAIIGSQSTGGLLAFCTVFPYILLCLTKSTVKKKIIAEVLLCGTIAVVLILPIRENFYFPNDSIVCAGILLLLTGSVLIFPKRFGKIKLKWVGIATIAVFVIVVLGTYKYGELKSADPQYLKSASIENGAIVLDMEAGVVKITYDGQIGFEDGMNHRIDCEYDSSSENVTNYKLVKAPYDFLSVEVSKDKEFDVMVLKPYKIYFFIYQGKFLWISSNREAKDIVDQKNLVEGAESLGSGRGYIWMQSLPLALEHAVIGTGPDNFAFAFPQQDPAGKAMMGNANVYIDKPHNLYLKVLIELGVLGLASLGYLIFSALKGFSYEKAKIDYSFGIKAALLSFCISSLFNDSIPSTTPIMMILIGLGIGAKQMQSVEERN